jgi:hypothetical protein
MVHHAIIQLGTTTTLSLHFFLFCQAEDDENQQERPLTKWHLLAFLAFLAVEVRKSAKVVNNQHPTISFWQKNSKKTA